MSREKKRKIFTKKKKKENTQLELDLEIMKYNICV